MNYLFKIYQKSLLVHYDKDDAIPYYNVKDFPKLKCRNLSFINSRGKKIHYYFYKEEKSLANPLIIFLPGIGPGHIAYFKEIATLCSYKYEVLTLDYEGCGESEGDSLYSLNGPTRDVDDLLNQLKLNRKIIVIGHSLGGYTAINIMNLRRELNKGVVISGFADIKDMVKEKCFIPLLTSLIKSGERKIEKEYGNIDNYTYLKSTTDRILFIHSKDDPMVNFKNCFLKISKINNPNFKYIIEEHKHHNPNYTLEAVNYKDDVIGKYSRALINGTLDTLEKRRDYFKDVSLEKLTSQDDNIIRQIVDFIK